MKTWNLALLTVACALPLCAQKFAKRSLVGRLFLGGKDISDLSAADAAITKQLDCMNITFSTRIKEAQNVMYEQMAKNAEEVKEQLEKLGNTVSDRLSECGCL